jgi:ZIP family zinc transporter
MIERAHDTEPKSAKGVLWLLGLLPFALLAMLLLLIGRFDATQAIRGDAPPVEELAFQRVELTPDGLRVTVLNDGPDPVTIAQVQVDEAFWFFSQQPAGELRHLGRARLDIPYPWVEGDAHEIRLITATGVTFDHEIAVAVETPRPSWEFFGIFALIGTYVGVLPIALGLLWYPVIRRLGRRGLDLVIALTVGLLLFLLIDTTHEGFEAAGAMAHSYQGVALFVCSAILAYFLIETFGAWLKSRAPEAESAWVTARLVAIGIGLHNFGEGLAIGAAFALGEAALGTLLIIGFTLHNTTEGLAIVAPLAKVRARVSQLALLGLIAGAPTIVGAWLGGFVYSPVWSVIFLAIGAGAIGQVVVQITRQVAGGRPVAAYLRSGPVIGGLAAGFALMYVTGMLIG